MESQLLVCSLELRVMFYPCPESLKVKYLTGIINVFGGRFKKMTTDHTEMWLGYDDRV